MTRSDLIESLRNAADLSQKDAAAVVDLFFGEMAKALIKGNSVQIRGLCSFSVRTYKAYNGHNPKTGMKVKVRPKKMPFFKCGKELAERVDGK